MAPDLPPASKIGVKKTLGINNPPTVPAQPFYFNYFFLFHFNKN